MALITLIRGGGDLASGVALRLYRAGLRLIITELPQPLVVRRYVSFAEAVYAGKCQVEGVTAILANDLEQAFKIISAGNIPVLVDPDAGRLAELRTLEAPLVLVDARMTKLPLETTLTFGLIGHRPGSGLCGRPELPRCHRNKPRTPARAGHLGRRHRSGYRRAGYSAQAGRFARPARPCPGYHSDLRPDRRPCRSRVRWSRKSTGYPSTRPSPEWYAA